MARLVNWNPPKIPDKLTRYHWGGPTAPYAPFVYFGGRSRGNVFVPGRDWVEQALSQIYLMDAFKSNLKSLSDISFAFDSMAKEFDRELSKAFDANVYPWPRRTRRRNRRVVRSPRDIVNLGNLKRSQRMEKIR